MPAPAPALQMEGVHPMTTPEDNFLAEDIMRK